MDIEKALVYFMFALVLLPLAGLGVKEYQAHQCRVTAIQANWEADKIVQVCGK